MSTTDQIKLESAVNKLIKEYGVKKAVQIIKAKPAAGLYKEMQNYPNGVFIYCKSPEGGLLVGVKG